MAATTAKIGFGVLLKRGDGGGPETFTAIAELKSINGPASAMDTPEATHSESPNAAKEFVAGLIEGGEITATCNFLNDGTQSLAAGVHADWKNRVKRNFQLVWPTPTARTEAFAAFVTRYAPQAAIDDVMTVEITLKITGLQTSS